MSRSSARSRWATEHERSVCVDVAFAAAMWTVIGLIGLAVWRILT